MKPNLKDLKTAHRVLTMLEFPVPSDLILYLSSQITEIEDTKKQRRIERMSDEELITMDERHPCHLRVTLRNGSFIQMKTNKETFEQVIKEINWSIANYDLKLGSKNIFHIDPTGKQRRVKKYVFVKPGFFVLGGISAKRMKEILERIDESMEMGWDVELI